MGTVAPAAHGGFCAYLVRKDPRAPDPLGTTLACDSFDTIAEGERFIDEHAKRLGLRNGCGWEDAGDGARVQAWHTFTSDGSAATPALPRPAVECVPGTVASASGAAVRAGAHSAFLSGGAR